MISSLKVGYSQSFDPHLNLAFEKNLLNSVSSDGFILYLWQNDNTVVIGRNQNPLVECNLEKMKQNGVLLARRLSGGGAVFHDKGNLNFTFLQTTDNYDLKRNLEIIKTACRNVGINAEISGRNDILAEGKKFSGNAFYSGSGKSYHHGTILINSDLSALSKHLTPSPLKLEAKGIKSVKSRVVNLAELRREITIDSFKEAFVSAAEEVLSLKAEKFVLTQNSEIEKDRLLYKSEEWLYGLSLPYTISLKDKFSWGEIEIRLNIIKGVIENLQVFSDSLDHSVPAKICSLLKGVKYNIEDIKKALFENIDANIFTDLVTLIAKN